MAGATTSISKCASLLLLAMLSLGTASAAEPSQLYQSQAVVTGTGEKNRQIGFALSFELALVKVSGDQRLFGDPRVVDLGTRASDFVTGFSYRDRLEGIPIHDEQGTYDRPHFLTVHFDPAKIDAALRSLGREPWLTPRPPIFVLLGVRRVDKAFTVVSDGERDADMRSALQAAAEQIGMSILLPDSNSLKEAGLDPQAFPGVDLHGLASSAAGLGATVALVGTLVWSDEALGWIADWRIEGQGKKAVWQIRGVGFDDAFRDGMRGAAQVLSGNGQPASTVH